MIAWLERIGGLVLLRPGALALALLVPLAWWAGRRVGVLTLAPATLLGARGGEGAWPHGLRARLAALPRLLQAGGLVLLAVALARPATRAEAARSSTGIDILLCLDTSSSMTANDLDPRRTRLQVAREAAVAFVEARPEDRIGLLTFARYADLVCPPTLDHAALVAMLDDVRTVEGDGPEDATGLGAAVARAAQVLGGTGGGARVAVVLTDGEENVAQPGATGEIPPAQAAQLAARLGVRVYPIVAGLGRRAPDGSWVRLDTTEARRLAERTGGAFHEARDAGALSAVYARIDRLEKAPVEDADVRYEDRYLAPLLLGLALLVLGRLLGATALEVLP